MRRVLRIFLTPCFPFGSFFYYITKFLEAQAAIPLAAHCAGRGQYIAVFRLWFREPVPRLLCLKYPIDFYCKKQYTIRVELYCFDERKCQVLNTTKLIRILCVILLAGVLFVEGLTFALIQQLNMIPRAYMVLLAAFLLVLWVALAALVLIPGKKKKLPGIGRSIVTAVLVICVLFGCAVASKAVIELKKTLDSISEPTELTAYVDVFVRADDPAQTVEDAMGYTFAITEYYDIENTRKAIEQLEAKYNTKITTLICPHVYGMADALYAGQADAMLINTAYIAFLTEAEGYTDFMTKAKLLEQLDIRYVIEPPKPTIKDPFAWIGGDPTEDTTAPTQGDDPVQEDTSVKIPDGKLTETPFVVYLAGSDYKNGGLATYTRNDVNILAVVNPNTRQVLLINTPRDFFIPNPAGKGALDKLTHCGVATVDNSVLALSQFYEVPIRYYAQIGFDGLKGLVDAVDGVDVYSEVAYEAGYTWINKGMNHLNGEQALEFARERKNIDGGDNARGNNQMKIIRAIVDKMISGKLITKYTDILRSIRGLFRTNMSSEEMAEFVQSQLSDLGGWNIVSYAVTGEAAYRETYSEPGMNLYVYIPNMDTVEYAKELMQRVVDGEVLEQSDIIPAK